MGNPNTTVQDRILAVAAERNGLLQRIAAAEQSGPTLSQIKIELAAIKNTFYDADVTWGTLHEVAQKEKKDLDEIDGSHFRKTFHRSKYEEQVQKEEKEYEEAQRWADKARFTRDLLRGQVDEMKKKREVLERSVADGIEAQNALDNLYASIFDGPTPDVAEEDKLEAAVHAAREALLPIQSRLAQSSAVTNNVLKAQNSLVSAQDNVAYAEQISKTDIVDHSTTHTAHSYDSFSSATADRRERRALQSAEKSLVEAEYHLVMAHRIDPDVKGFDTPYIADGNSVAGILDQYMNTGLTDRLFHREILATKEGLREAAHIVEQEKQRVTAKTDEIRVEADAAEAVLESARRELFDARTRVFEQAVSDGSGKAS